MELRELATIKSSYCKKKNPTFIAKSNVTILFSVAVNRNRFHSVSAGSEGQNLHAIVCVLAQSVKDCLTSSDDFGIFAGLICFENETH